MVQPQHPVLPKDFLRQPAPEIKVSRIDFVKANLPRYDGLYAVILDNVLSPEECDTLVAAAESSTTQGWERALVNIGRGEQASIPDVRNCGRIIWDSHDVVDRIWNRIAHIKEVQEIVRLENVPRIFGMGPVKRKEVWKFTRPNERMRFLKYVGGEYFRPHCDGTYETPDGKERTYFTLHLYLNNASVLKPEQLERMTAAEAKEYEGALVGGATTFQAVSFSDPGEIAVMPEAGRILLFQHRDLLHSGDDVLQGVKYTMRTDLMFKLENPMQEKISVPEYEQNGKSNGKVEEAAWFNSM